MSVNWVSVLENIIAIVYIATFAFTVLFVICLEKNIRIKDLFSPRRWRSFYIWLIKKHLKAMGESNTYLTRSELIQYSYRVANCFECIKAGKCVHCGCDAEGRMNNRTDSCSDGKWGMMISEEELDEYLNDPETKLTFKIEE